MRRSTLAGAAQRVTRAAPHTHARAQAAEEAEEAEEEALWQLMAKKTREAAAIASVPGLKTATKPTAALLGAQGHRSQPGIAAALPRQELAAGAGGARSAGEDKRSSEPSLSVENECK